MTLKTFNVTASAVLAALTLSACVSPSPAMNTGAQSAVKQNIAAQAITPPADQKANINIPADPTLRAAARERYKTGAVIKPVPVSTD